MSDKNLQYVDLVASGYEWICPECQTLNLQPEVTIQLICFKCKKQFVSNFPIHAMGK